MNEPKIRFQGFEREWKSGKIEEVAALQGGYAFQSSSFCKDGVPIVRIANILHSGEIGEKSHISCLQMKDRSDLLRKMRTKIDRLRFNIKMS